MSKQTKYTYRIFAEPRGQYWSAETQSWVDEASQATTYLDMASAVQEAKKLNQFCASIAVSLRN